MIDLKNRKNRSAFTLTEILVYVIVFFITIIMIMSYTCSDKQHKHSAIENIDKGLTIYVTKALRVEYDN